MFILTLFVRMKKEGKSVPTDRGMGTELIYVYPYEGIFK